MVWSEAQSQREQQAKTSLILMDSLFWQSVLVGAVQRQAFVVVVAKMRAQPQVSAAVGMQMKVQTKTG